MFFLDMGKIFHQGFLFKHVFFLMCFSSMREMPRVESPKKNHFYSAKLSKNEGDRKAKTFGLI